MCQPKKPEGLQRHRFERYPRRFEFLQVRELRKEEGLEYSHSESDGGTPVKGRFVVWGGWGGGERGNARSGFCKKKKN